MRSPEIKGTYGEAWILNLPQPRPIDDQALITIMLKCPKAHPAWQYWYVATAHLRNLTDQMLVLVPNASHDLIVVTADPVYGVIDVDAIQIEPLHILQPPDQHLQITVPSDAAAVAITEQLCRLCCDGKLSPDSDYRNAWKAYAETLAAQQRGEVGDGRGLPN